jgi:hypothetical protein
MVEFAANVRNFEFNILHVLVISRITTPWLLLCTKISIL